MPSRKWGLPLIWSIFFVYSALAAAFIQFVALPHLFPQLHWGHGLLVGGDWCVFHKAAVTMAERIRTEGWSVWELRLKGSAPAGIAALLYRLVWPEPWTFIPLNAALHATAGVLLIRILESLKIERDWAVLASLPFVFFPSALGWVAQMHKDGFSIAGTFFFLYGWILFSKSQTFDRVSSIVQALAEIVLGTWLIWLVRPYQTRLLVVIGVLFSMGLLAKRFFDSARPLPPAVSKRLRHEGVSFGLAILFTALFPQVTTTSWEAPQQSSEVVVAPTPEVTNEPIQWFRLGWLPAGLESRLYSLTRLRQGYIVESRNAGSNLDTDVIFHSPIAFLAYLPRAFQIALFAPFPDQWFGSGREKSGTLMRRVSAFEMSFIYLFSPFLFFGIWVWRRRRELWLILSFCAMMLLVHSFVIVNIGTLYRMRYGYLMLLVGLSVCGFGEALKRVRGLASLRVEPA